jgi:putative NIF3 family GTP cyclohydrolase 1 type 2
MNRLFLLAASVFLTAAMPSHQNQTSAVTPPTAQDIVGRIQKHVTCEWSDETVDTFKGGDPNTPVTGVATTFMATLDVLKRAKAMGLNFIITHEPTFYNHLDELDHYGANDATVAAKMKYIKDNGLVVWRFHDHWHRTSPDGILTGEVKKLGWTAYAMTDGRPAIYKIPETTLSGLADQLKKTLQTNTIRVIGDPAMKLTKVGLVLGAAASEYQVQVLDDSRVDVLVVGETREWETVEYTQDLVSLGMKKALIIVGHRNSEEYGMDYCADWLKGFVTEVPVKFVPAGDPFWTPK